MNPLALPLLADENIHPGVIDYLRRSGMDVMTVREAGLGGASDVAIIQFALAQDRIILTHDSDFGRLVFTGQNGLTGIIYLRPGHIRPDFTIATLQYLESCTFDIHPPFIIVAERSGEIIRLRVRQL